MYERKVEIDGQPVLLKFQDYAEIPARISRVYTGRAEAQLWAALAWGLTEPKQWPVPVQREGEELPTPPKESTAIFDGIFDTLPMRLVMDLNGAWQRHTGVTEGESDASSE